MTSATTPARTDVEAVTEAIFKTGAAFDTYNSQLRRSLGLNAHERLAVSTIWARGPQSMSELGRWIPLSRAAVTTLVDRLETAGFVRRGSDGNDRRRTVVSLTDSVTARLQPIVRPWIDGLGELLQSRSDTEWQAIVAFMHDFHELNDVHATLLADTGDEELRARSLSGNVH